MTIDQANMLLFPIEIARIISILIHGTNHGQGKEGALNQVGCYISKTNSELSASVQLGYFDESHEENVDNSKKLLSLQRKAFIDTHLSSNETFTKKALCWYDLPMSKEFFDKKEDVTKTVNDWAVENIKKSAKIIDKNAEEKLMFHPLAGHSGIFANDRIIVATSSYLKIKWKPNLFYKSDTKMDQTFVLTSKHFHHEVKDVKHFDI